MSRTANYIVAGNVWTVTSLTYLALFLYPSEQLPTAVLSLLGCLALVSLLATGAALAQSQLARYMATTLHVAIPLAWMVWLASLNQALLSQSQWTTFALCAFLGAALADHGVAVILPGSEGLEKSANAAGGAGRNAWESGGFSAPSLSACDSGSFRRP